MLHSQDWSQAFINCFAIVFFIFGKVQLVRVEFWRKHAA